MSYLGWIGNLFLIIGLFTLATKWRPANLFLALGDGLWTIYGIWLGFLDIAAICGLFTILSLRVWWLWRKDSQPI